MEWFHHKERPIRQQLTEAIEECARQLEFLRETHLQIGRGGGYIGGDKSREIALMEVEYQRLVEALKDLRSDGLGDGEGSGNN